MTIKELFWFLYNQIKDAKIDHPHLESSWIIEKFVEISDVERIQSPDRLVNKEQALKIQSAIIRRLAGEPLAYVLNEVDFYGYRFYVDHNVLIPRPETELLVDWALDRVVQKHLATIRIADLGVGSGCVGLALLKKLPQAHLVAIDKSEDAIEVAKRNAKLLGVEKQVNFFVADAEAWLKQMGDVKFNKHTKFDIILANPPYIDEGDNRVEVSVRKFEPHSALFSGEGGLEHIYKWSKAAAPLLVEQGAMAFEIGDGQSAQVINHFQQLGIFQKSYIIKDYAQKERIICGEK
jgi:release factor glutamine methyltransferase